MTDRNIREDLFKSKRQEGKNLRILIAVATWGQKQLMMAAGDFLLVFYNKGAFVF